ALLFQAPDMTGPRRRGTTNRGAAADTAETSSEDEAPRGKNRDGASSGAEDDDSDNGDDGAENDNGDADSGGDGSQRPKRRRRRGGRGRRRSSGSGGSGSQQSGAGEKSDQDSGSESEEDSGEQSGGRSQGKSKSQQSQGSGQSEESKDQDGDQQDHNGGEGESQGSSRRRRRRRGGRGGRNGGNGNGGNGNGQQDGSSAKDEVTALKGSTRLEAKRQRRKEGRSSKRRRAVLTEAEFLARRESVERKMVVRAQDGRTQIAVLEDDVLVEHYVARKSQTSMVGNVYLGRVQNVLPSMEAAFVDLGKGRNAVLYAGEVNWGAAGLGG